MGLDVNRRGPPPVPWTSQFARLVSISKPVGTLTIDTILFSCPSTSVASIASLGTMSELLMLKSCSKNQMAHIKGLNSVGFGGQD